MPANPAWSPRSAVIGLTLLAMAVTGCEAPSPAYPTFVPRIPAITPPTDQEIRDGIARGVDYLVKTQKPSGHWGSGDPTIRNIWMPGYREKISLKVAVTSLAARAMMEADIQTPEAQAAIARVEDWMLDVLPGFRRQSTSSLFNTWGHAYAIEALTTMLARRPMDDARRETVRALIKDQVRLLATGQSIRGGWGYYTPPPHTRPPQNWAVSFLTATALVAFHRAEEAGIETPQGSITTGLRALRIARFPNGAFSYNIHFHPRPDTRSSQHSGAVSRSQAGNLALFLYDDPKTTRAVLKSWVTRLIEYNGWVEMTLKDRHPHMGDFAEAGYYYYYGYYYGAQILEHLAPADRERLRKHIANIILSNQDADGAWWDFVLFNYHKSYGTAYALMTLQRCLPEGAAAANAP